MTSGSREVTRYAYDGCDQLESTTYADGKKVSYKYDKNDNLTEVTDRTEAVTTYTYDAINQVTEIHRPNGVSTYNTYNARDQITDMKNICDDCEWTISEYHYTYDDRGFIVGEDVTESLYAYDGDGNRIFQLNYNLHTDDDWKGNSGNGNGNNKDNSGSGNSGIAAATGQEARIRKASWRV